MIKNTGLYQDGEKMSDFIKLSKDDFLESYSYLSEKDYNDTLKQIKNRLRYLKRKIMDEIISYGELAELQDLIPYIEPGDVELLEAAGVPEFKN